MTIRQPIITIAGHVDHGKTTILDSFRGTSLQRAEAGGITQKISFTKYPIEQIKCSCPLIEKSKVKLEIPGFLFIDTPGHAAFTHLRKRGGSLADLAIVVVAIKEGIQPQTAEVLQILKNNNVPFVIALNKIDSISGWTKRGELKESIESQAMNVSQEFQEALLTFQGSLREHGFDSSLFYEITDYTKQVAIVPCSARTKEGISELLFMLCGLCQRFLKERLKVGNDAKGIILEVKKEKNAEYIESILYDGELKENDMIAIATFNDVITSKIRAIEEIQPLSLKYSPIKKAHAATGIRLNLTNKEGILAGMPFQKIHNNLDKIKAEFKKEISEVIHLDKEGIIIKADSLGSLEALITLLRQENIQIIKAGIGPINKTDIINAKANLELNPLNAMILGFNVKLEDDTEKRHVKILTNDVVYKLIEDLKLYRKNKQAEIEKEKLLGLATICKLQILPEFVFRNSNPAIFGVRVLAGKLKIGIPMMDEKGEEVARVKSIQHEKAAVQQATEDQELALALPGVAFDRRLKEVKYLYAYISDKQFKDFKKNKELLSANELKVLQEIAVMKGY